MLNHFLGCSALRGKWPLKWYVMSACYYQYVYAVRLLMLCISMEVMNRDNTLLLLLQGDTTVLYRHFYISG